MFYFLRDEYEIVKLLQAGDITRQAAYDVTDRDLDQLIFHLKHKLKAFDIEIDTAYKCGWKLTAANRVRLNAFIDGCAQSPVGIPVKTTKALTKCAP